MAPAVIGSNMPACQRSLYGLRISIHLLADKKEVYTFSDHTDQILQAFYGDDWRALKPKEYKGLHYWLSENKRALIEKDRVSLDIDGKTSYMSRKSPRVRLSSEVGLKPGEKIIDDIPGVYTYQESQELFRNFVNNAGIPLDTYHIWFLSSEDPTMTKEKSHYYYIRIEPMYSEIPISQYRNNGVGIAACVTDDGLVFANISSLPQTVKEVGEASIINPSEIAMTNLMPENQDIANNILHPSPDFLSELSGRDLFSSDGSTYKHNIVKLTPKWSLQYAVVNEGGRVLIKPVWLFSAYEFELYEMVDLYYILFDAQNGIEMPSL
jgi:hypothetical protein